MNFSMSQISTCSNRTKPLADQLIYSNYYEEFIIRVIQVKNIVYDYVKNWKNIWQ